VLTLDARALMAKQNVSFAAPQKENKQDNRQINMASGLEVSPSNVMVALAQTGSKS